MERSRSTRQVAASTEFNRYDDSRNDRRRTVGYREEYAVNPSSLYNPILQHHHSQQQHTHVVSRQDGTASPPSTVINLPRVHSNLYLESSPSASSLTLSPARRLNNNPSTTSFLPNTSILSHHASLAQLNSSSNLHWPNSHSSRKSLQHSFSQPERPTQPAVAVASSTITSPRRHLLQQTQGVSSRLYLDPTYESRLQYDSSKATLPFVPRGLPPLADPSPLISQWMAMLAWESHSSPSNKAKLEAVERMLRALDEQKDRHEIDLRHEAYYEGIRETHRNEEAKVRRARRETMHLAARQAEAAAAEAAANEVLVASGVAINPSTRKNKGPSVRFGGYLPAQEQELEPEWEKLPTTFKIPMAHAAFVCDLANKISNDFGRFSPLLIRILRILFHSIYQGYAGHIHNELHQSLLAQMVQQKFIAQTLEEIPQGVEAIKKSPRKLLQQAASGSKEAISPRREAAAIDDASTAASVTQHFPLPLSDASSTLPSAPLDPSSIVPYFHVAHLLNVEYHKGVALIHSYQHTQQNMHVQGLKRSDVLNGAVRRMQRTLYYHVFQRWKFSAKQKRRQRKAFKALEAKVTEDISSLIGLKFLHWKYLTMRSRRLKDEEAFQKAAQEGAGLKSKNVEHRKEHALEMEILKSKKEIQVHLNRELEETKRTGHHVELQQASLDQLQVHRLLDSTFDLLLSALDSLTNELEMARSLNLQDPLRMLAPLRTSFDWENVYQDTVPGSSGWALLRRKEAEAAKIFFDGSGVQYESHLAFTQADAGSVNDASGVASSHARTGSDRTTPPLATSTISASPQGRARRTRSTAQMYEAFAHPQAGSLASNTVTPYNYTQEVEIILLWFNFHLIQSQSKTLAEKQLKKVQNEQKAAEKAARRAAAIAKGILSPLAPADSEEEQKKAEEEEEEHQRKMKQDTEMEWFDGSSPVAATSIDDAAKRKNRRASMAEGKLSLAQQLDSASVTNLGAKEVQERKKAEEEENASNLRSRDYFIDQFTSAEALARRVENFTTSLQDSELMLRLVTELAPEAADMDLLTHIDLGSRARMLIRMIERLNDNYTGMVTSLDFVHAFNSDRVAGLLARLLIDYPRMPIQGAWFDRSDYMNRSRKPFLQHTDPVRLAEQIRNSGTEGTGVHSMFNTEIEHDFGPLSQLNFEIIQFQQLVMNRTKRISPLQAQELHTHLKQIVHSGRRILDDAYFRHDIWIATKNRLKGFIVQIFTGHIRGKPLKLDDPRALKEKALFCAVLENPLDAMWKAHAEAQEEKKREMEYTFRAMLMNLEQEAKGSTGSNAGSKTTSPNKAASEALQNAINKLKLEQANIAATGSAAGISGGEAENQDPREMSNAREIAEGVFPHGKPQNRFLDLLSHENRTGYDLPPSPVFDASKHSPHPVAATVMMTPQKSDVSDRSVSSNDGAASPFLPQMQLPPPALSDGSPQSSIPRHLAHHHKRSSAHYYADPNQSPLQVLSFELHVIQNLLNLFYDELRKIWKAYAQADANSNTGIAGSNRMNLLEFWTFVKDCGLSAPNSFTAKQVEQVFLEVFMTRMEKKNKVAVAANGNLHMLTALQFDTATGLALPPKDKDKLELSELDFIEVLVRIAFLRKVKTKEEKLAIVAEWRSFQRERMQELQREKQRIRLAQAHQRSSSSSMDMAGADDEEGGANLDMHGEEIAADEEMDPLASTYSAGRNSFNASMRDSLTMDYNVASNGTATTGEEGGVHLDETYGVDFENSDRINDLNIGLSLRFFGLLKLKILPKANKLDADTFRSQYKNVAVSRLFRKHGVVLRKLFFKYATLRTVKVNLIDGAQADSWSNTIDYIEFVTLLKDLHLIIDGSSGLGGKEASKMLITPDQAYGIFANVQQELHVANSNVTNLQVKTKATWERDISGEGVKIPAATAADAAPTKDSGKKSKPPAATATPVKEKDKEKEKEKEKSSSRRRTLRGSVLSNTSTPPRPPGRKVEKAGGSPKSKSRKASTSVTANSGSKTSSPAMPPTSPPSTNATSAASSVVGTPVPKTPSASVDPPASPLPKPAATILPSARQQSSSSSEDDSEEDTNASEVSSAADDDDDANSDLSSSSSDGERSKKRRKRRKNKRSKDQETLLSETLSGLERNEDGNNDSQVAPASAEKKASVSVAASSGTRSRSRSRSRSSAAGSRSRSHSPSRRPSMSLSGAETAALLNNSSLISSSAATPEPDVDLDVNPLASAAAATVAAQVSDHSEMIYPEYLESLAAIACFRYPNPFTTTAEKIHTFLEQDVLPFVTKLLKRNYQDEA